MPSRLVPLVATFLHSCISIQSCEPARHRLATRFGPEPLPYLTRRRLAFISPQHGRCTRHMRSYNPTLSQFYGTAAPNHPTCTLLRLIQTIPGIYFHGGRGLPELLKSHTLWRHDSRHESIQMDQFIVKGSGIHPDVTPALYAVSRRPHAYLYTDTAVCTIGEDELTVALIH